MAVQISYEEYVRKILLSPVYDVAKVTSLQKMEKLSDRFGNEIFLKREDEQVVHSFKLRGAYNKIAQLPHEQLKKGIVAASAGNHAQGCALSSKVLGIKANIVMPRTTPDIKVEAVRRLGGNAILFGNNFDEAYAEAIRMAKDEGLALIPPYDDPDVIAGQGTIASELLKQNSHITHVFVQVGGGGLAAGIAVYIKQIIPHVKVIAVEAEGSACFKAAYDKNEIVTLDRVSLFADGVAVKKMGTETFRVLKDNVDEIVTVTNDQICAALKDIFDDTRAIAEPAGALSLAGMKKYIQEHECKDQKMVAILSGANLNFHTLRFVSERCELGEHKEGILAIKIPEKKGSFMELCKNLGARNVTEFNYRYSDQSEAAIFISLQLSKGRAELDQIIDDLSGKGYSVTNLTDNLVAKNHIRYMIGGHATSKTISERLFSLEFPERPGALMNFLEALESKYNVTMFHYRNHGAEYGRVLCALEMDDSDYDSVVEKLNNLGYLWFDETDNECYKMFLSPKR